MLIGWSRWFSLDYGMRKETTVLTSLIPLGLNSLEAQSPEQQQWEVAGACGDDGGMLHALGKQETLLSPAPS